MKPLKSRCAYLFVLIILSDYYLMGMETIESKEEPFRGGSGTDEDPYVIEDVWDLQNMSKDLSAHYILKNDIDAYVTRDWNSGDGFVPVGNQSHPFTGSLDGKYHAISGLYINHSEMDYVGLFGYIGSEANMSNLILIDTYVNGNNYVGGIAGYNYYGFIRKCDVDIMLIGNYSVGGLVGYSSGSVIYSNSAGKIIGNDSIGGIIGDNRYASISDSHSSAKVIGNYRIGGLIGITNHISRIIDSYATGTVTGGNNVGGLLGENNGAVSDSFAYGTVIGNYSVGGFVGENNGLITDCVATGDVKGNWNAGGFLGLGSHLSNCHAIGNVTGNYSVGGLVGTNLNGTISNCFAQGSIGGNYYTGGLVGTNWDGMIVNSYSSGSLRGNYSVGGLVGRNRGIIKNSHYNVDQVLINGDKYLTIGGLYDAQYLDWFTNDLFLDIFYYPTSISQHNGYYDISTVQGLRDLLGFADIDGLKFRIVANIDLSLDPGLYVPYFGESEFDSNNHTISNMNVYLPFSDHIGMFGYNQGGTIKNMRLVDSILTGHLSVGGIIGYNSGGVLSNSYFSGYVSGDQYIGGLIGYNSFGNLSHLYFRGRVSGDLNVGGLTGANYHGKVSISGSTGNVLGIQNIGGLVGENRGSISESYVTGDVTGRGNVGGIAGRNSWGSIDNSYATGCVSGIMDMGGFVGNNHNGIIKNAYSTGKVVEGQRAGGLVGYNGAGAVSGSFWDIDSSELNYSDGGSGKTQMEMITASTFTDAGWDLIGVWYIIEDVTYPLLRSHDILNPVPNAGPDQTVDEGEIVTFDGSGSHDNIGIENWTWTFIDGDPMVLYGVFSNYRFDTPGFFIVTLNVTDTVGLWHTDTMTVTVIDITPPVADAGEDRTVDEGDTVMFDGVGSIDNVGILKYTWTFIDRVPVTLSGVNPSFRFDNPGVYIVTLNVSDAADNYDTDTITITVNDITPPIADAGPDQIVDEGDTVMFDGSGSIDNVGILNFRWSFTDGVLVTLHGLRPSYLFSNIGVFVVTLNVTDAKDNWNTDSMTVTVNDITPPVANAGEDQIVAVGTTVLLNGSLSTDNVGIKRYSWTFSYEAEIQTLEGEMASFTFNRGGFYQIVLNVTDLMENFDEDVVTITVIDTGTVLGVLLDRERKYVKDAKVEIIASNGMRYETMTGSDGSFSLEIYYGSFTWSISKNGYRPITGSSSVDAMDEIQLDLSKHPMIKEESNSQLIVIISVIVFLLIVAIGLILCLLYWKGKRNRIIERATNSVSDDHVLEAISGKGINPEYAQIVNIFPISANYEETVVGDALIEGEVRNDLNEHLIELPNRTAMDSEE